jgi:PAS domain S-box-containing protein
MTGLEAKSIIGRKVTEVLPGIREGSFDWVAFYGQVALSGETEEFTQYADVLGRWYKVTAFSPERGFFATVFQDITPEIESAETLEKQKAQIQSILYDLEIIFNSTQDPMTLIEYRDGKFVYQRNNAVHQKITGFSDEEIKGKTPVEVHGDDVGGRLQKYFTQCISDRKPLQYEITYHFPEGDKEWISNITPVIEDDKIKYLVISSKDITEMQTLRRKNAELSQRLQAMFENHMAVMLSIEPESGRILDANPRL